LRTAEGKIATFDGPGEGVQFTIAASSNSQGATVGIYLDAGESVPQLPAHEKGKDHSNRWPLEKEFQTNEPYYNRSHEDQTPRVRSRPVEDRQ